MVKDSAMAKVNERKMFHQAKELIYGSQKFYRAQPNTFEFEGK